MGGTMSVIQLLQGLLTPVIGGIAVYIAWQQWKGNQLKLRLDGYDRRLRVYQEVKELLGIVLRDADLSHKDLAKFASAFAEADFLFGADIPQYLDELYRHGLKLRTAHDKYNSTRETPNFDPAIVDEIDQHLKWFTDQYVEAIKKFRKYLNISGEESRFELRSGWPRIDRLLRILRGSSN
jgi:uncharacterized ubiquitin-like protein YukD